MIAATNLPPDVVDAESGNPSMQENSLLSDETTVEWQGQPSPYASQMRCLKPADWHYGYRREWDASRLT